MKRFSWIFLVSVVLLGIAVAGAVFLLQPKTKEKTGLPEESSRPLPSFSVSKLPHILDAKRWYAIHYVDQITDVVTPSPYTSQTLFRGDFPLAFLLFCHGIKA